jgi:glyoxylase-like metal-dependent hydrolase (beta-lactamase superfamily II)
MKVHHMNCGIMKPRGARLVAPSLAEVWCNCLLVEAPDRLVLVDTGLGQQDMEDPGRLGVSNLLLHAVCDQAGTAASRISALGYEPRDVRDVICTHLDRDHAGGLPDFPRARVHVLRSEQDAALHPANHSEKDRYRRAHFSHGPQWVLHGDRPDGLWMGLQCLSEPEGLPEGIVLVPLQGHTRGHCGVAVRADDGWLLHCGDAYYVARELDGRAPLDVAVFRRIAHCDFEQAMTQIEKLKRLHAEGEVGLIASHDRGGVTGV